MILGKKPHDLPESGGQAECNIWCYATLPWQTSFALEVSLLAEPVLSFRIFSDDIPCLNIFSRSFFWEKEFVICLE